MGVGGATLWSTRVSGRRGVGWCCRCSRCERDAVARVILSTGLTSLKTPIANYKGNQVDRVRSPNLEPILFELHIDQEETLNLITKAEFFFAYHVGQNNIGEQGAISLISSSVSIIIRINWHYEQCVMGNRPKCWGHDL